MSDPLPTENPGYQVYFQYATRLLLLALAYFAGGRLGLAIPYIESHITLIWIPTGIAVAALLRWGWALWPGIFMGSFLVDISIGSNWQLASGIAVGNTLGPSLTAWMLSRRGFDPNIERHQDLFLFGAAAILGSLLSALAGVVNLELIGTAPVHAFGSALLAWWMGDLLGVYLAAPLLLTFTRKSLMRLWMHRGELLVWAILACVLGWAVFFGEFRKMEVPLISLTLPMVIWAAMRFGSTGTSLSVLVISLGAAVGAVLGYGPFQGSSSGLFLLWSYISTLLLSGLMITTLSTEQERASRALRMESDFTREMINSLPGIFYLLDMSGRFLLWNRNLERVLHCSSDEIAQSHPLDFFAGSDKGLIEENIKKVFEVGETSVEAVLVAKNGATIPYLFTGRSIDRNGERALVGMGIDISEIKHAHAETNALLRRNQALMKTAADGIHILDIKGDVIEANDSFCNMLGYTQDEVVRLNVTDWDMQFTAEELKERLRKFIQDGISATFETIHRRKDGSLMNVEVSCSGVSTEAGQFLFATSRDITGRKLAETEIHSLAFYDALTHLPNRRLLMDRLNQTMALGTRNGQYGAILFLDLDNFKNLNDTKGHDIGDLLLVEVAKRLQSCVREGDTVGRFGGDEFVLILEGLSTRQNEAVAQAEMVAEKVRAALGKACQLNSLVYHTTTSIGINLFLDHAGTTDELFKQADMAMYQAKHSGRNAIRFFDPAMQAVLEARSKLEEELRVAVEKQQFHLYYQIQVDASLQPIGAEILLRWKHPELIMVPPGQFVPLAEETGMIIPIGLWVLETACTQIKLWENNPLFSGLNIAVNVSARQFRQQDFVEQIKAVLGKSGINPGRLKLELTESLILNNVEDSISKMGQLNSLGVEFSMDDFGMGYSSLSYLKRLPLDQIKIDQSFVRDIASDPNDAAIVQTIIVMAETLGLKVMAEGVETDAQREFLELRGCPAYQGFLFSKPVPLQEFEELVVNWEEKKATFL